MRETTTYIYIIAKKQGGEFVAPVKIGFARNPDMRLQQFKTSAPFPIGIFGCFATPSREHARTIESAFHQVQRDKRAHGEWFDIPPGKALIMMVMNLAHYWLWLGFKEHELQGLLDANMEVCRKFNEAIPALTLGYPPFGAPPS